MGARGAEPGGFGDRRKDGSEAEEVVASVTLVAQEQLRGGLAGAAFLANDIVGGGGGFGWLWSMGPSSSQCCCCC